MNGYFSRLMEQSGISAEPAVNRTSAVPVKPPNRSEERDMMASTHAERDEPIEATQKDSGPIVAEVVQERVLHGEVSETPPRRRELDTRDSERRGTLERGEAIEGATFRAEERSSPGVGPTGKALTVEPGAEPQDRIGLERVWQNTLREVREWVAVSPVADDEETENRGVSRARDTTSMHADSHFVEERVAASYPRPIAPSPREEAEAQDLRLEIGIISVTVEEPQEEIPKKGSRRTETAEKKSANNGERSRLSRHYLRVR